MSKVKITGNASGTGTLTIAAPNTNTDRTLDIPDAAGDLVVAEGGTFKIDSSGNVGIGTSSPSSKLQIQAGDLNVGGNDASNPFSKIRLGATQYGACDIVPTDDGAHKVGMAFYTDGTADTTINPTERMRIDSSGNVLVGTTSNEGVNGISFNPTIAPGIIINKSFSGNANAVRFWHNSSTVGSITYSNTATAYNTSSDYRLKTDVQPMTGATERLKALKPVNFEWISSGERTDGFLAHEAQEIVPEAVHGTKDAVTAYGNITDAEGTVIQENVTEPETLEEGHVWTKVEDKPNYQGIDQSKLVPLLVATIQEQQAAIEALTARVEALEAV